MDFNFSFKIYHTKVYITFTKVVVFFTRKLAKLVSHFFVFLWISTHFTTLRRNTQERNSLFAKRTLERFKTSQICPRHQKTFTQQPPRRRGARRGWCGTREGNKLRLGLPVLDWGAWFDRRGRRRVAAVEQWQHSRGGANSGEGGGTAGQCAAWEAPTWPREGARMVERRLERAEQWTRRWLLGGDR
jgi:hypothetical protein